MTRIFTNFKEHRNFAFTMAEILLSLTIIGVVAAITLPSLTGNINERTWNTQRKALYARMSQAMALMPALNGFGTYNVETDSAGSTTVTDTAAQAFVTELGNVLKINNVCDNEHLSDCGIPDSINCAEQQTIEQDMLKTLTSYNPMYESYMNSINTKSVAIETQNNESILIFYNPRCVSKGFDNFHAQPTMCANFVFDLNGRKGPNTFGKDIGFITAFYPSDSVVVAPHPVVRTTNTADNRDYDQVRAGQVCRENFDNARVPNIEELMAMGANRTLLGYSDSNSVLTNGIISSSRKNESTAWLHSFQTGLVFGYPRVSNYGGALWCVDR